MISVRLTTANGNIITKSDSLEPMKHQKLFSVLLALLIPSLICSIYLFIRYIKNHAVRQQIHNHITLALLVANFLQAITDIPPTLILLDTGTVYQSDFFCTCWIFADYVLNVVILMLVFYGSVERFLLVFHHQFFMRHIWLLYNIPIGFCFIYPTMFYVVVIFLYPCITIFNYNMYTCGGPCYLFDARVSAFDQLVHILFPTVGAILVSFILIWRVIRHKQRMKVRNIWKKNRRMTLQILSICLLHIVVWCPIVTFMLIVLFSPVPQPVLVDILINWVPFGYFCVILLYPFVYLIGLTELWMELFKSLQRNFHRMKNAVGAEVAT